METSAAAPSAEPMEISDPSADSSTATEEASVTSPSEEMTASMEESDEEDTTVTLWCSGDAPDSPQQHNFEGAWKLYKPAHRTGRPSYEHIAPGGTSVFLYFVDQVGDGPCPRWVIGPDPEGDGMNGWAYTDSSAMRPEEIIEPWHSWVKETAEWGEARLAFSKRSAELGRDADVSEEEEEEEAAAAGDAAPGSPAKKKKKAKKKGGKKGGGGKGGAKAKKAGGEGKKASAAKAPSLPKAKKAGAK